MSKSHRYINDGCISERFKRAALVDKHPALRILDSKNVLSADVDALREYVEELEWDGLEEDDLDPGKYVEYLRILSIMLISNLCSRIGS